MGKFGNFFNHNIWSHYESESKKRVAWLMLTRTETSLLSETRTQFPARTENASTSAMGRDTKSKSSESQDPQQDEEMEGKVISSDAKESEPLKESNRKRKLRNDAVAPAEEKVDKKPKVAAEAVKKPDFNPVKGNE